MSHKLPPRLYSATTLTSKTNTSARKYHINTVAFSNAQLIN